MWGVYPEVLKAHAQKSEHSTGEYIPCVMSVTNTRAPVVLIKEMQRQKIINLTEECEDDFEIRRQYISKSLCIIGGIIFIIIFHM